jgi:hypothetical protein
MGRVALLTIVEAFLIGGAVVLALLLLVEAMRVIQTVR